MLKMIFKDLRISPLRNILTSISMLVGIIAMIGSFLVGTLGKDYLISVDVYKRQTSCCINTVELLEYLL